MLGTQALQPQIAAHSEASGPAIERLSLYGDSDFLQAVSGKDPTTSWSVMYKHIEVLRVVNLRDYEVVMQKLSVI